MPDYGHDLTFGAFITPSAKDADLTVALAAVRRAGRLRPGDVPGPPLPAELPRHLDAAVVRRRAHRTRHPAAPTSSTSRCASPPCIARSVASLDLLSGGRVELGLGAGAFWDAIEANGGRRLHPRPGRGRARGGDPTSSARSGTTDAPGGVASTATTTGSLVPSAARLPRTTSGIWLGAYKPRMLALVGRAADGWLPSLSYLGGPADLDGLNEIIDEAAVLAGREPTDVRRLLNIGADLDAEQIAAIALEHGTSTFILGSDEPTVLQRFMARDGSRGPRARHRRPRGTRVRRFERPAARNADTVTVTADPATSNGAASALAGIATVDDGVRLSARTVWDEGTRPVAPAPPADHVYDERSTYVSKHLVDVHDHLRQELTTGARTRRAGQGRRPRVGDARSAINEMTMRQNDWTLGAYCASLLPGRHRTPLARGRRGVSPPQAGRPRPRTGDRPAARGAPRHP